MHRPMTLFTGQWADLPLDEVAAMAAEWGYDGLELACWGDHFDVPSALAAGMERTVGAPNALEYLRSQILPAPTGRFDAAFGSGDDS
jgi:sugar phosphate isomerase/epimerase